MTVQGLFVIEVAGNDEVNMNEQNRSSDITKLNVIQIHVVYMVDLLINPMPRKSSLLNSVKPS